ncbi:hypothetical protein NKH10_29115 [Mesorhizobium sp. M1340]|uniref:hypothetical protein n=1 Tax=unclassified Mesorhizobium TaxID=325217 RepID=UPI00333DB402
MSWAWISKLALAAVLASPTAGWAQSVSISYLTHWSPETVALLDTAAKDYAKTNPDVTVTVLRSLRRPPDDTTFPGWQFRWADDRRHL